MQLTLTQLRRSYVGRSDLMNALVAVQSALTTTQDEITERYGLRACTSGLLGPANFDTDVATAMQVHSVMATQALRYSHRPGYHPDSDELPQPIQELTERALTSYHATLAECLAAGTPGTSTESLLMNLVTAGVPPDITGLTTYGTARTVLRSVLRNAVAATSLWSNPGVTTEQVDELGEVYGEVVMVACELCGCGNKVLDFLQQCQQPGVSCIRTRTNLRHIVTGSLKKLIDILRSDDWPGSSDEVPVDRRPVINEVLGRLRHQMDQTLGTEVSLWWDSRYNTATYFSARRYLAHYLEVLTSD